MKTKKVKLSEITPAPNNPRKITKKALELLKNSIKEFPEMVGLRPIIIDENNIIIGGNMRYKAMQQLGYTETVVIIADSLTEAQKKEFMIKDNVSFGVWDMETLGETFSAEALSGWGLDTDFKDVEEIKNDIMTETEYQEIAKTTAEIIEAMTDKVNYVAQKHPEKLKNAFAVIITNGAGNKCLILSDPETADIVNELERHASAGIRSPLEKLFEMRQ